MLRAMSRLPVRLLIIDNALDHTLYRPVEHWRRLTEHPCEHVHAPSGAPLPEPGAHDHVILTGSEDSITRLAPWAEAELAWLRRAVALGVRVLGSCWGHQLIARALGGPGCVRRAARPELGWIRVDVSAGGGLMPEGSFEAFSSHFDEVVAGSHPELRVLASTPACAVHALRWGELPCWGIQAHPEIDPESGRGFLAAGGSRWPEAAPLFAEALRQPVRDSGSAAELVRRFLAA